MSMDAGYGKEMPEKMDIVEAPFLEKTCTFTGHLTTPLLGIYHRAMTFAINAMLDRVATQAIYLAALEKKI